ncbi:YdcF family protein [Nocardia sp. 2]|uniref:YdcF family protein n=1 Tax=Nocardia acididurans TaxID=2802282 RepID=A0ABS1MAS9_9NOCA|nr:YdcF family protein [Nocardia acididurans]MBL1077750.1 YdcF family protein [Nocardia acididurans]
MPNTLRTNAVRALLAGVTVTVIATATPAHADPVAAPPIDPFDGFPDAEGRGIVQERNGFGAPGDITAPTDIIAPGDVIAPVESAGPADVTGLSDITALADAQGVPRDVLAAIDALGGFDFTLPGLQLPALFRPDTAIVVLGYGLEPDGGMRLELINRLYAGYVSALLSPEAPVIVTGGNPQNGVTEAQAMADWLIDRGIDPGRIHTETQANSTVQNATFSARLMQALNVHAAVLITSADHIARALSNFRAAGIAVVATMTPDESPLAAEAFGPGE